MNVPAAKGQKGDLSRAKTRECFAQIRAHVALCGLQETIEAEDNEDLAIECPPSEFWHVGTATENDIVAKRSRLRLADLSRLERDYRIRFQSDVDTIHGGKAGWSPHRTDVEALFEFVENPEFDPFVFVNTHATTQRSVDQTDWGKDARADWFAHLQAEADLYTERGLNVIGVADTNWRNMPLLHPDMVWLVNDGIDKIWFIPSKGANWGLRLLSTERHKNPSDHDFRVANVEAYANAIYHEGAA